MLLYIFAFVVGFLAGVFTHRWIAQEAAIAEAAVAKGLSCAAAKITPIPPKAK
jgi:hypothetical protein